MKTSIKLLWGLFALIMIFIVYLTTSMRMDMRLHEPTKGNGQVEEKTITVEPFSGIKAYHGVRVIFRQADAYDVRVVTDANLQDFVFVNNDNGWLEIGKEEDFGEATQFDVYVTAPEIESLRAFNSSEIIADSVVQAPSLDVYARNSAHVRLLTVTENLALHARNSGGINVSGETNELEIRASSSSEVDARDLLCQFAEAESEGSSTVYVRVNQRLESNINGGSHLWFDGPDNLSIKASGSEMPQPLAEGNDPM